MTAYYNEIDPYAAQWLRNLIEMDLIAPGEVDERSIVDVRPSELKGYTQCHFFAGIGVWSYALRKAGWPDSRPVWTGSCPCGPFSQAGQGKGFDDERHLWPHWYWHIGFHKPETILGEQVSSADGLEWLDLVQTDMENAGYAFAAPDLCSAGIGAPNIRQRLFFVGHASGNGLQGRISGRADQKRQILDGSAGCHSATCRMGDTPCRRRRERPSGECGFRSSGGSGAVIPLADAHDHGCQSKTINRCTAGQRDAEPRGDACQLGHVERPGPVNGFWKDADWLFCRDERWRPVEPGTFPLAPGLAKGMEHGRPEPERLAIRAARTYRRGTLRGYGNALNAELASTFITEAMHCINDLSGEAQS